MTIIDLNHFFKLIIIVSSNLSNDFLMDSERHDDDFLSFFFFFLKWKVQFYQKQKFVFVCERSTSLYPSFNFNEALLQQHKYDCVKAKINSTLFTVCVFLLSVLIVVHQFVNIKGALWFVHFRIIQSYVLSLRFISCFSALSMNIY